MEKDISIMCEAYKVEEEHKTQPAKEGKYLNPDINRSNNTSLASVMN